MDPRNSARRRLLEFLLASPLLAGAGPLLARDRPDAILVRDALDAADVFDFEAVAKATLPPAHWGYLATGVDGDATLRANRRAIERRALRTRRMVDVSKVDTSIELFGERYLRRVFTAAELDDCAGDVDRLTGRFAAKEAVLKVLEPGRDDAVPWRTIEIRTAPSGAPYVVLSGTARALAARQAIERIDISLSHDGGIGLAVAAAVRPTLWEEVA